MCSLSILKVTGLLQQTVTWVINVTKNKIMNIVVIPMSETDWKANKHSNSSYRRSHSQRNFATSRLYAISEVFYHWIRIDTKRTILPSSIVTWKFVAKGLFITPLWWPKRKTGVYSTIYCLNQELCSMFNWILITCIERNVWKPKQRCILLMAVST